MSDQKRITLLASNLEKIVLFVIVSGLILSVITILGLCCGFFDGIMILK